MPQDPTRDYPLNSEGAEIEFCLYRIVEQLDSIHATLRPGRVKRTKKAEVEFLHRMLKGAAAKIQLEIDHLYRLLHIATTAQRWKRVWRWKGVTRRTLYKCGVDGQMFDTEHAMVAHCQKAHKAPRYAVLVGKLEIETREFSGRSSTEV